MDEENQRETVLRGRYRLTGTLGRGAMGTVFLAHDSVMDRRVAIKILRLPEGLSEKARDEAVQRFYREARLAGKLIHPNIVATFDIDRDGENHFISMELVEGKTLAIVLEEGRTMDASAAVGVAVQVCQALEFAHAQGVVHRDIKPGNIFITGEGKVKVGDFGIARSMDSATLTQTGYSMGTPQYMSPEQVRGEALDPRSDLFSLGVVLYEMLEGSNPFAADTPPTVIYNILEKEPPSLEGKAYAMPGLMEVLNGALSKDVETRYQSAGEMARDLRALLSGEEVAKATAAAGVVSPPQPLPPPRKAKAKPPEVRGKRKRRIVLIAAAVAVCIALAVALLLIFVLGGEEELPDPTRAVTAFFNAMREGNTNKAESLLTPRLRDEIDLGPLQKRVAEVSREAGRGELDFTQVEIKGDSASMEVWLRGELLGVSLGLWRLVWLDDRWHIDVPGFIGDVQPEEAPEGP